MGPTGVAVHFWAIYHIKGTPAKFVGIVNKAPDEADGHHARDRGTQDIATTAPTFVGGRIVTSGEPVINANAS